MTSIVTDKSAYSHPTTLRIAGYVPCVRYGFPEGSGHPKQAPVLRSIFNLVPEDAETASPIYLLTSEEYDRQQSLANPYAVRGADNIAKSLQDKCERDGRVLYPIHVESDEYHKRGPKPLIEWFTAFVEDELGIPISECTFYYSGSRSIHVHVPRFSVNEADRERLKDLAARFCDETGAELDIGLYDRKRQFRLPGVVHTDTGLAKTEIQPGWSHERIIRAGATSPVNRLATYADLLTTVFSQTPTEVIEAALGDDPAVVFALPSPAEIPVPMIEQDRPPNTAIEFERWNAYNRKEFSPYAKSKNGTRNGRSVAIVRVVGGAFARKTVRNGATLVPAFFYGAKSCDGTFTKVMEHAPLQLSDRDSEKWSFDSDDIVVLIGGRSRNSRIFEVDEASALVAAKKLCQEPGTRRAALTFLEREGFDVGASGGSSSTSQPRTSSVRRASRVLPATDPRSEAAELQRRAEQGRIQELTEPEIALIAIRLLQKYGWGPTWDWFEKQYGVNFKPKLAYGKLKHIADYYDDLSHVQIPPPP